MRNVLTLLAVLLGTSCSSPGQGGSPTVSVIQDASPAQSSDGSTAIAPGLCGTGDPCGGDITGTWSFVHACFGPLGALQDFGCADATTDESGVRYEGTIAMGADLSFTFSLTRSGSVRMTLPAACLDSAAPMTSCDDIATFEEGRAKVSVQSIRCQSAGADGGCICDAVLTPDVENQTGTYMVTGTSLHLAIEKPEVSAGTDGYCVRDSQLTLFSMQTDTIGGLPPGTPMYLLQRGK